MKEHELPKLDVGIPEAVNHPAHYNGKYECIEVMKDTFGNKATEHFCILNAFKYLYRCYHKNNCTEDLEKADWYIQYALKLRGDGE